jgi:hypothetical protein
MSNTVLPLMIDSSKCMASPLRYSSLVAQVRSKTVSR